jgi:addiction module RelB/DinJ family antitoxin
MSMNAELKREFDAVCQEFGLSAAAAFIMFAQAVVRERRIPIEIEASPVESARAAGKEAFSALRQSVKERDLQGMNLDDINEEIRRTRIRDDR